MLIKRASRDKDITHTQRVATFDATPERKGDRLATRVEIEFSLGHNSIHTLSKAVPVEVGVAFCSAADAA